MYTGYAIPTGSYSHFPSLSGRGRNRAATCVVMGGEGRIRPWHIGQNWVSICKSVRGRGTIIPWLLCRIPSELRSQAPLGRSSTEQGDLSGSPGVVPTFLAPQARKLPVGFPRASCGLPAGFREARAKLPRGPRIFSKSRAHGDGRGALPRGRPVAGPVPLGPPRPPLRPRRFS